MKGIIKVSLGISVGGILWGIIEGVIGLPQYFGVAAMAICMVSGFAWAMFDLEETSNNDKKS